MTHSEEGGPALDARLEELAAGVVKRIAFDPPELKAKLQPPKLRVLKGRSLKGWFGVNSYSMLKSDGTKTIMVGPEQYPFFLHYTRAAATYFLPDERGGPRPSSFWPRACSAVAITLDWLSSPAPAPLYPEFDLSPQQAHVARAFADYAYRFALCHEMAHVALEHLDANRSELRTVGSEDYEALLASQQQELEADRFGLNLQIKSISDSTQLVTALESAVYFVHITGLLDDRLMLLAHLVDYENWNTAYTHPRALERVFNLMGAAEGLRGGSGEGLKAVHASLSPLDGQLYDAANTQQEEVTTAARSLVSDEVARRVSLTEDKTQPGSGSGGGPDAPGRPPPPDLTRVFLPLFNRSALEPPSTKASENLASGEGQLRSFVMEQLALALPLEFQEFRSQTRAQRAEQLA